MIIGELKMIYAREVMSDEYITYDQMNLIIAFQKLWSKLAVLIRTYIKASIYETPNYKYVGNSLLELPAELYNLFLLFYGLEAAENVKQIFTDFIATTMEVVELKKYGDKVLTNDKIIQWYTDADKIANYLSRINIYWDEEQWKYLLYQYIKLKLDEIDAVINGEDETELKLYNTIENINFIMANYMGRGIIASQQLPPV